MPIFVSILVVTIIFVILLDWFIARMYRNPKKSHQTTPAEYNIAYEEVRLPLSKRSQLYGWWISASPNAPTIILVHGWGRNLSRMLQYIVHLYPLGYNLLAFDARNHGSSSSERHPTVGTFSEDTLAAINFIVKSGLVSSSDFGIIGLSIGGGAAINAASSDKRVKGVITVGALSHPMDVMKLEFQKRNIPNFIPQWLFRYIQLRFGIDFNRIAPVNNISRATADIFLIHGGEDTTIPLAQGQMLEKVGNSEKIHLWVVPGKGHSDCETYPEFWDRVEAFLQMAIPVS
jgi:pimeloyl-ACP methyl ester carboxylesterase